MAVTSRQVLVVLLVGFNNLEDIIILSKNNIAQIDTFLGLDVSEEKLKEIVTKLGDQNDYLVCYLEKLNNGIEPEMELQDAEGSDIFLYKLLD